MPKNDFFFIYGQVWDFKDMNVNNNKNNNNKAPKQQQQKK